MDPKQIGPRLRIFWKMYRLFHGIDLENKHESIVNTFCFEIYFQHFAQLQELFGVVWIGSETWSWLVACPVPDLSVHVMVVTSYDVSPRRPPKVSVTSAKRIAYVPFSNASNTWEDSPTSFSMSSFKIVLPVGTIDHLPASTTGSTRTRQHAENRRQC